MNEFGIYLKKLRESKNLTLNELASKSSISAAQISRIETGKRSIPKSQTIKQLSEALEVPFTEMFIKSGHLVNKNSENKVISKREELVLERLNKYPELMDIIIDLSDEKIKSLLYLLK